METLISGPFSLAAVILAAGRSSRMGRPKLLLPWGETSVLGHLVRQWKELGASQVAVVCATDDGSLHAEMERLDFPAENRIYNASPDTGMFGSIQCAARFPNWNTEVTHWAVVLGDQPHLRADALHRLLEFSKGQPRKISQPSRSRRGRHPVILPRAFFSQLGVSAAETFKEFLSGREEQVARLEMNDAAFDLDLDFPADYEEALRLRAG
jgi:molybdenum cofactor cytidylyltransferase